MRQDQASGVQPESPSHAAASELSEGFGLLVRVDHKLPITIAAELASASQIPQLSDSEKTCSRGAGRSTIRNRTQAVAKSPISAPCPPPVWLDSEAPGSRNSATRKAIAASIRRITLRYFNAWCAVSVVS